MCDIVPGQLVVSFPQSSNNFDLLDACKILGARHVESMEEKLARSELKARTPFPYSLHLIEVEPGEENHATAGLYSWFHSKAPARAPNPNGLADSFVVAPNYILAATSASLAATKPSGKNFSFGPDYSAYQNMTGMPTGSAASCRKLRVLIVDTGIASDAQVTIYSRKNLLKPFDPQVDDDNGHGTALALLIDDLAPSSEFIIYKAGDAQGNVYEWDLLAALVADSGAHVINLSVEYGLAIRNCQSCGRQSSSSRSAVFENLLNATSNWANRPVIVAAAGNGAAPELAYPARFGNLVAVGSVNSSKRLAKESNTGDADHNGTPHKNHFVAPGGDTRQTQSEFVIELSNGSKYHGTSFACAFASAVVLATMDSLGTTDYSQVLDHLRQQADKSFSWHSSPEYGLGVIRV